MNKRDDWQKGSQAVQDELRALLAGEQTEWRNLAFVDNDVPAVAHANVYAGDISELATAIKSHWGKLRMVAAQP